jgi:hypothetical protein
METRREDGKLDIDLMDDDDDDVQAPVLAAANPLAEDNDVVFVSANPVKRTRAERERAAIPTVKNEN